MILLHFSKYSGAGNDFILIDDRAAVFPIDHLQAIQQLCHRQQGIGADGLILLQTTQQADFRMRILNADGSEAEMCGNGLRCFAKFLLEKELPQQRYYIETLAGTMVVDYENNLVRTFFPSPCLLNADIVLKIEQEWYRFSHWDTSVPHAVLYVATLSALKTFDLAQVGPIVRQHAAFGIFGTNVNVIYWDSHVKKLFLRTYERGVEAETLACGTGAVASALAVSKDYQIATPITVVVASGAELEIAFTANPLANQWSDVSLIGDASKIFCGSIAQVAADCKNI